MSKPQEYYAKGKEDEEAARLKAQANAMHVMLEEQFKIMSINPSMRILDAGCGSGDITNLFASMVHPTPVVGLDINPSFIEKARINAEIQGIENVRFDVGNIDEMPYSDGEFDLTYCRLVLMHVKDPLKSVLEMKRVTRKGGLVVVDDTDDGPMIIYPPAPKTMDFLDKLAFSAKRAGRNRHMGRELYWIFKQAGLESIDVHPIPMRTRVNPYSMDQMGSIIRGLIESVKDILIQDGLITNDECEDVLREWNDAVVHPGSFGLGCMFLAIGKVP